MRRVVSVWFPHWPTDRLRRRRGGPPGSTGPAPLVTASHDGRKRVVAAVDPAAAALGLRPGLAMAQALALVPGLEIVEAEPGADAQALHRLALWCHGLTPLAAPCPPDGLWLDVTGCAHLAGGESALLRRLLERLARDGLQARAAVADTAGAAHAFARHGPEAITVVPPEAQEQALAALPIAALRIPPELEATLRRLGFECVAHLARVPRALLARRFGTLPGQRLDQALGRAQEPIDALPPEHALQRRLAFVEPLLTAESFQAMIPLLAGPLCAEMELLALGARQLDLLFERVDGHVQAIRIGTASPSRDPVHLVRLLVERLETIDPGLGVEAMRLVAPLAEPLRWEQQQGGAAPQAVTQLVDRLQNRLGAGAVYCAAPVETGIPERMTRPVSPGSASLGLPPACDDLALRSPDRAPPAHDVPAHAPPAHDVPAHALPAHIPPHHTPPHHAPPRHAPHHHAPHHHGLHGRTQRSHLRLISNRTAALGAKTTSPPPGLTPTLHLMPEAPSDGCGLEQDPPLLPWKPRPDLHAGLARPTHPWPNRLHAPPRLLTPPRLVKALAALPDQPPVAFTWRRRHRIRRAEGPERVFGEWWRAGDEAAAVRDYFIVEDEEGQRFWLYRRGDGLDPGTGNLEWFLHGLF